MSKQSEDAPLDESILSNELIRLLGSENQRLKRELQEAEDRAKKAGVGVQKNETGSKVVIKKEESGDSTEDLAAAERVQQLLEEMRALKAKFQKGKEKRKTLKAQVSELKSKIASNASDTSADLQKKLDRSRVELEQARSALNEMQERIDSLVVKKDRAKTRLDEAKSKIASLTRNDPWSYISDLYDRHGDIGFFRLKPFQADRIDARDVFNAFYDNTLKPRGLAKSNFVYRGQDIIWSDMKPGYGLAVEPTKKYVPARGTAGFHWVTNKVQPIDSPFELFYETFGYWYYVGTYVSSVMETRNNAPFFTAMDLQFKNYVLRESIQKSDLLPPSTSKSIWDLYNQGIMPISCLIFERTGFNQALNDALLEFGKDVVGPEFALDIADSHTKKRCAEGATMPPKSKKARADPPSTTTAGASG